MVKHILDYLRRIVAESLADPEERQRPQPYIKKANNDKIKRLINYWWSNVFYNDDNLKKLATGCPIESRRGYGLIYYYIINDKLRYIGKTREQSLKWRMTRPQQDKKIGYSYQIKRLMLNASKSGKLRIQTKEIAIDHLDATEEKEIRIYSRYHKLWNIEFNDHYQPSNRRH